MSGDVDPTWRQADEAQVSIQRDLCTVNNGCCIESKPNAGNLEAMTRVQQGT